MNKTLIKHILLLVGGLFAISCSLDEIYTPDSSQSTHLKFIPRPTTFVGHNVTTRSSSALTEMEQKVVSAYFLAFNNKGERFFFDDLTEKLQNNTIPSNIVRSDIRTTKITVCYLANVPYEFASSIKTIEDLNNPLSITYTDPNTIGAIGVPLLRCSTHGIEEACIPMSAIDTVALPTQTTTFPMELKRLFAKMDVEISLNLEDYDADEPKIFALSDYSVQNLPTKVLLQEQTDSIKISNNWKESDMTSFTTANLFEGDPNIAQNSGISLSFYVPEHIVNPTKPESTIVTDEEGGSYDWYTALDQRFKPLLIGSEQFPTYLTFKGVHVNPENLDIAQAMSYDIYLGRNNFDDFYVLRNYRYNNKISIVNTINGEGGYGIDHRVNINVNGFLVGFQRATLLDAHYEVRPLRVKFPSSTPPEGTIKVEILNEDGTGDNIPEWIRLERPSYSDRTSSSTTYYESGKRKYFTNNLVTETINGGTSVEYSIYDEKEGDIEGDIAIWVYVDEYPESASDDDTDKKNRRAKIRVTFTPDEITEENEVISQTFTIQQRAMYPLEYGGRSYNIEYFEEYLYDYDSQDNYGQEGGEYLGGDGVVWGFDGVQLSHLYRTLFVYGSDSFETIINSVINNDEKYDYYLTRDIPNTIYNPKTGLDVDVDNKATIRDYSGYKFNCEAIISQKINNGENLALNDEISSAIEYCYRKNKVANGQKDAIYIQSKNYLGTTYNTENYHWYLPAIDEMEDIVLGGQKINFFNKIFTESWYWSSQSSYNRYYMYYYEWTMEICNVGEFYVEDTGKARATKLDGNKFKQSNSEGYTGLHYRFENAWNLGLDPKTGSIELPKDLKLIEYEYKRFRWREGAELYTFPKETDNEGVHKRTEMNRVRCIYNPDPPKTIKVSSSGEITYE